jgi:glycine/D-amino acid oxidase-like deaminating enzyme
MKVDYIIVGQGIAGTMLSYQFLQQGCKIAVIDTLNPASASRVASGLINPVTGKRHVKTWMADELLPAAVSMYKQLEKELNQTFLKPVSILNFHSSAEAQHSFNERIGTNSFVQNYDSKQEGFNYEHGIGEINSCLLVNPHALLHAWSEKLQQSGLLLQEPFDIKDCTVTTENITYKSIEADKIIFCDGVAAIHSPYFKYLPFRLNKGEAVIARIPGLSPQFIYKRNLKIAPWQDDTFWIGASFEWSYEHVTPTTAFIEKVQEELKHWLKLPYEMITHMAAERPSTIDYKPFIGLHPQYPSVGIFNGMGTKGCSLAPYFAREFVLHLTNGSNITKDVDISRFHTMHTPV